MFVVTGMYILGGNLLSNCALKIKTPKTKPTVITFCLFVLCKTRQTFGESRLRCGGTKHEYVLVLHSAHSLMVGTGISRALTKPKRLLLCL